MEWLSGEVGAQFEAPDGQPLKIIFFNFEDNASAWHLLAQEKSFSADKTRQTAVYENRKGLRLQVEVENLHALPAVLWQVTVLGNSPLATREYSLAEIQTLKPLFNRYLAPCFYEPDAGAWQGRIPQNLTRTVIGTGLSNCYVALANAEYALLIGTPELVPDGKQTLTPMGAKIQVRHSNTSPGRIPHGVLILGHDILEVAERYNALVERFLPPQPVPFAWWGEPQWCSWVPYREKINEEIILENARAIREYGFPIRNLVIDAGWYDWSGSWQSHPERFPMGMEALVNVLHKLDFRVILWFNPHAVKEESPTFPADHEGLVLNAEGFPYGKYIDWPSEGKWHFWDPTHPAGKAVIQRWLERAIKEWRIDGIKVDYLYAGPEGRFQTLIPLETNTYVFEVVRLVYNTAKALREDFLVSGCYYNRVLSRYADDLRAGDTFGGCNLTSLRIAREKMAMARLQVPDTPFYVNDYIGSYDQPIDLEVFLEWLRWLTRERKAVLAFGWPLWELPLLDRRTEILRLMDEGTPLENKKIISN